MGKREREKGRRREQELVRLLKRFGLRASRVPLSGAANTAKCDVVVESEKARLCVELKARKDGWKQLHRWLTTGDVDMLVLWADRKQPLVVVDLDLFAYLLQK